MLGKLNCYVKRLSILLITVALIAGMVGCDLFSPSQDLEIRDWYDLDAIRNNLRGHQILMNDLNSTTAGYTELASPTANGGKGWQPIGTLDNPFSGTFDGQGYEIHDLFINRLDEDFVGLFGVVNEGRPIEDIGVVNADVTGYEYVGGLVGGNVGTVSNSYSTGSVSGNKYVGGLVGYNEGARMSNSYSTGSVSGNRYVGGLVGLNGEVGTVSNSYSSGNVTGSYGVGGLVGGNVDTVSNSYSTGSVSSNSSVGGLVGRSTGTVSNSYSTGSVTGNEGVGGLMGWNEGTVSNSFWDIQTSGQATSDGGGTGKNTTEMKDITTFSGAAGWNIIAVATDQTNPSYIWNIVDHVTYPFLSWQS
jgi:hypothetical protein